MIALKLSFARRPEVLISRGGIERLPRIGDEKKGAYNDKKKKRWFKQTYTNVG